MIKQPCGVLQTPLMLWGFRILFNFSESGEGVEGKIFVFKKDFAVVFIIKILFDDLFFYLIMNIV